VTSAKTEFPPEPTRGERRPTLEGNVRGGTIVNVITAVIFFGLLALGIWWIIKSLGEAGQQYTETLIETKYTAETVKCQSNLRAIWQNVQMYAVTNGAFPPSIESLKEWSGNSRLFRCPSSDRAEYVYIRGQNGDMPAENVLLYESEAVHDGRCSVLRLGGQLELLSPEELKAAVSRTLAYLR
jgi:hypothetical protein